MPFDLLDPVAMPFVAATFTPDSANRKLYDEQFREFLHLYRQNRGIYARLNGRKEAQT